MCWMWLAWRGWVIMGGEVGGSSGLGWRDDHGDASLQVAFWYCCRD
jgi:hypothetical protein